MRWRLLAHPYFTGAVAVLALNDQVLKRLMPGFVTGKLSDFAGVFVVVVGLTALTARPRVSTCASGLGFAAIKLTPLAAALVAPFLGGVTRQDPTDLAALAVLVPAYRFCRRWFPSSNERTMQSLATSLMSGAVAVLAVSATSCLRPPLVDAFVVRADGTAFARVYDETYVEAGNAVPAPRWAVSTDGGASWRESSSSPQEPPSSARQACTAAVGCFRVEPGGVEHAESAAGPFTVAFEFTREQRDRMEQRTEAECDVGTSDMFKSVALVTRPDGDHVVVAMGSQGALHRSPGGAWSRVAVLDRKPVSLHGPSWLRDLSLAPLIVIALSPVPFVLAWRRQGKGRGLAALGAAAGGGVVLLSVAGGLLLFGLDYVIAGPVIALLAIVTFLASLAVASRGNRPFPDSGNP